MSLPALVVAVELRQIFLGASQITNLFVFLKSLLLAAHVHSGLFSAAGSFPVLLLLTCSLCSLQWAAFPWDSSYVPSTALLQSPGSHLCP